MVRSDWLGVEVGLGPVSRRVSPNDARGGGCSARHPPRARPRPAGRLALRRRACRRHAGRDPLRRTRSSRRGDCDDPCPGTGGYAVSDLIALGRGIGLTDPAWAAAVENQTNAARAKRIDDQASCDGNTGTPSLVVSGKRLPSLTVFDPARLEAALEG